MAAKKKPMAEKATPEKSQRERFIEAARKAGVSDEPQVFDRAFMRVVRPKKGEETCPTSSKPRSRRVT